MVNKKIKRFKLVYLINGLGSGGAETMLFRLLQRLNRDKYDPYVIALLDIEGPLKDEIKALGIQVFLIGFKKNNTIKSILKLYMLLKRISPTILHTQLFASDILGRIIGRMLKVPVVITSIRSLYYPGRYRDKLISLTEKYTDRTTIVSYTGANRFVEKGVIESNKIQVIHSGIDPSGFYSNLSENQKKAFRCELKLPSSGYLILAVGSLTVQKDYASLIEAIDILKNYEKDFTLVIAGVGEKKASLAEQVDKLMLYDKVLFLGRIDNVPKLMAAADMLVLSSIREGLPGVVLEAMASELPVVATSVGGVPEIILDGLTGYLVEPKKPNQLACLIYKVLSLSSEERRTMGRSGRKRVTEYFHVNKMVERYEEFYNDCLIEKKLYS